MCLILFAHDIHPAYRLVLAANRDEFYARPTAPAGWWPEAPAVFGGRDLAGGGSWFGIDRQGRWAAVTNVRDSAARRPAARSRGLLVQEYLAGTMTVGDFLARASAEAGRYNPFNLLLGDAGGVGYFGSRAGPPRLLSPGLYGLSNAGLDTPWPKVAGGKAALAELLAGSGPVEPQALFGLLADTTRPPDPLLPDTGVGLERERVLAPRFIASPDYGTRVGTVLLVRRDGAATFVERSFERSPSRWSEVRQSLPFPPPRPQ